MSFRRPLLVATTPAAHMSAVVDNVPPSPPSRVRDVEQPRRDSSLNKFGNHAILGSVDPTLPWIHPLQVSQQEQEEKGEEQTPKEIVPGLVRRDSSRSAGPGGASGFWMTTMVALRAAAWPCRLSNRPVGRHVVHAGLRTCTMPLLLNIEYL